MREQIKNLLKSSFVDKELFLNKYFSNCKCFAISTEYQVYELARWTPITFEIAGVMFYNEDNNLIQIFAVDPKYRGKRYGYYLLKYLLEDYVPNDEEIILNVRISNTNAISLYKSFGFNIKSELDNYYEYTGIPENAYLMSFIKH